MHIYCTGGLGFSGSHLVDHLLSLGHHVTIYDNMSRGNNLPTFGEWDFDLVDLSKNCPDFEEGSVVFHLAARVAGIAYNSTHHYMMQAENQIINHNVMEAVLRSNPRLFVYTSSACVYGPGVGVPTLECAGDIGNPQRANFGYGVAKWAGEQQAKALCLEYGVPTIIVRPYNLFGVRDHYEDDSSHVVPALIKRLLSGEDPLTVWGSGNQTRSFLDVSDMAAIYVKLMDWALKNEPLAPIVVNAGHAREVSIRDLVQELVGLCVGRGLIGGVRVVYDTSKPDGDFRRASDTALLHRLIGWVPNTPLRETLDSMVTDYLQRFK